MGCAGNADDTGATGERGGHGLRPVYGEGGVLFAVNHDGGAGDLTEARGDIVAAHETAARFGEELLGALAPFCDPARVLNRLVDDQGGDPLGKLVDWAGLEPHIEHALVGRLCFRHVDVGGGVEQHERANTFGREERGAKRDESALRHTADDGAVDTEVVEQGEAVAGGVPIREGLTIELSEAKAALVPGDDAELTGDP